MTRSRGPASRSCCFRQLIAFAIATWLGSRTASAQPVGAYASHQQVGRSVVVATDAGQRVRVTPYGDAAVRIQAIAGGAFLADDALDMIERHDHGGAFAIADSAAALELTNGAGARIRIQKAPLRIQVFRAGAATPVLADGAGLAWGGGGVTVQFARDAAERFAGLGHGFFGRVGKLELTNTEVARNYGASQGDQAPLIVPFYLSSKGYGVFVNSASTNRFRFGPSYEVFLATGELDYVVLLGPTLPEVLAQYTALTGRPRLPPLAMFGLALSDKAHPMQSSAAWWQPQVHAHRAAGWPLDHLVNDNRWRAGGGERCLSRFDWDPERYPDPAAFRSWMQRTGLVATLDFNRCIANQSTGWQPSFNLPDPGAVDFGTSAPDLSRADVRAWWWNLIYSTTLDPARSRPGDALWIDEFDELGSAPAGQVLGNGRTWADTRNAWFLLIARALGTDGWNTSIGEARRPFTWVRGGTAGGQRSVTLWSGDIDPTYAEMKLQIRGMLAAGLGGFPFWGHDAGGFHGEAVDAARFDELYRQWSMAFGAFTPYWKPHGTVHSRWPAERTADAQHAATVYGELRYQLLPYTYSAAREAAETGLPIARAMLLAYPEEPDAWARDQQYLWGSELLVVPNAAAGYNDVSVWLPPGRWYDWWSDAPLAGGRALTAWAPQGRTLLYARAGAIIPMAPAASSTAFLRRDVLDIHVYAGADGAFTLREDDGVTESYRTGGRTTALAYDDAARRLTIRAAQGTYAAAPDRRRYRIHFHGPAAPACAADVPARRDLHEAQLLGSGSAWTPRAHGGVLDVIVPATAGEVVVAVRDCALAVPARYEAEAGTTNATLATKPDASAGSYVGGLNLAGRFVELSVTVERAGDYDLTVGYANGRPAPAVRGLYLAGARIRDVVFPPTPDWDAFAVTGPVRVTLAAGANAIRLQTDAGDGETVDLDFLDVAPAVRAAPFHATTELLVVEAEHFHARTDAGGHTWREVTYPEDYAGDGAVIAWPNLGETRDAGPELAYDVELARAATYTVWVRGRSYGDPNADALAISVDDASLTVELTGADDFTWFRAGSVELTAGPHTLGLHMLEDGAIVDRLLLTSDPGYTPDGTGPDESPHEPPPPTDGDPPGGDPASGCGCHTTSGGGWFLLALALLARSRRSGTARRARPDRTSPCRGRWPGHRTARSRR